MRWTGHAVHMRENTCRVLIGKQEEKNNLQDLDTDGSKSNLSYRSTIAVKLAGFICSECWQVVEPCEHEINSKVIPWLNY